MSTSAPRPVKGLTHEQRYSLCLKKQQCPTMRQSELAAWFKEKYAFGISQPTVSHSLKKSAEILAIGISAPGIEPTRVRNRPVRHPELELALYQWVRAREQEYQQKQKTGFEQPSGSNHTIRAITALYRIHHRQQLAFSVPASGTDGVEYHHPGVNTLGLVRHFTPKRYI
ncbi:hypothetical protein BGZ50_001062 [Haplosporangium sp. Z 11]|nr:hypothetical protein BGZ50_001062 [Haplosporangium sp. Z 11]